MGDRYTGDMEAKIADSYRQGYTPVNRALPGSQLDYMEAEKRGMHGATTLGREKITLEGIMNKSQEIESISNDLLRRLEVFVNRVCGETVENIHKDMPEVTPHSILEAVAYPMERTRENLSRTSSLLSRITEVI